MISGETQLAFLFISVGELAESFGVLLRELPVLIEISYDPSTIHHLFQTSNMRRD